MSASVRTKTFDTDCVDALQLVSDLWGGTEAMRLAKEKWLPQFTNESDQSYTARLFGAVLFGMFKRTIAGLTGKPFGKPITIGEDVPGAIVPLLENVDNAGTHLDVFMRGVFEMGLRDGLRLIIVEMPRVERQANLADELALGARPYWVEVDRRNILGFRAAVRSGKLTLTQLRILEKVTRAKPNDEFADETVEYVRVYDAGLINDATGKPLEGDAGFARYRLYREPTQVEKRSVANADWQVDSFGPMAPQRMIPVAIFAPKRTGIMAGEIPLIDLAHLNRAHWASDSDQRKILHTARVPTRVFVGFDPESFKSGLLEVGGDKAIVTMNPGSSASFLEHSGAAIEAGAKDLESLEARARVLGLEVITLKPVTATEAGIDADATTSELHAWVRAAQDCAETALTFTAIWKNAALVDENGDENGGSVSIHQEFGISSRDAQELTQILALWEKGGITQETLLNEFMRRDALSADLDVEAEITKTEKERDEQLARMGALTGDDNAPPKPGQPPKEPAPDDEEAEAA